MDEKSRDLENVTTCEACGWEDVQPEKDGPSPEQILEYLARPPVIPEGECINSDQIDTFMTPQDFIDRNE